MSDDLACRDFVELVTAYLEDALAPDERARFEAHPPECPFCGTYLDQMRATVERLDSLDAPALPTATRSSILAAFKAGSSRR